MNPQTGIATTFISIPPGPRYSRSGRAWHLNTTCPRSVSFASMVCIVHPDRLAPHRFVADAFQQRTDLEGVVHASSGGVVRLRIARPQLRSVTPAAARTAGFLGRLQRALHGYVQHPAAPDGGERDDHETDNGLPIHSGSTSSANSIIVGQTLLSAQKEERSSPLIFKRR